MRLELYTDTVDSLLQVFSHVTENLSFDRRVNCSNARNYDHCRKFLRDYSFNVGDISRDQLDDYASSMMQLSASCAWSAHIRNIDGAPNGDALAYASWILFSIAEQLRVTPDHESSKWDEYISSRETFLDIQNNSFMHIEFDQWSY